MGTQTIAVPQRLPLDGPQGLIEQRAAFLAQYQNAAYAERYRSSVERVRAAEQALGEPGRALRLTRAVAQGLAKLMAVKDEYEVARLYTDGRFEAALKGQFESWDRLSFHMAPPLLAKPGGDGRVAKIELGGWAWRGMRWLASLRGLRGHWLDPFGHTAERRMERALLRDYEALLDTLLTGLRPERLHVAVQLALLPESIRGYGHVKQASVATARARQQGLLSAFLAADTGAPADVPALAQHTSAVQLRGVAEL
jgi:indolepyruvate ferredoxin oxidoreductase